MRTLWKALRDQRGLETLEWVLVGTLMVAAALAMYRTGILGAVATAININVDHIATYPSGS